MKTRLDLQTSASAAVLETIETDFATAHAQHVTALDLFKKHDHAPEDWPVWFQDFCRLRAEYVNLRRQQAPSEIAKAQAEAAAKLAAAAKPAVAPLAGNAHLTPAAEAPKPA